MNKTKELLVIGLALFSMFFGAGNTILPPFLGFNAGESWSLVALGFFITAVFIPILGIVAHSKLQGTMYDFGKKVSPLFSSIYCVIVYVIAIALPTPRTASTTHEMAIAPLFEVDALVTSSVYFLLVFVCVLNRSSIIDFLGKYLTPLIGVVLLTIIGIGLFASSETMVLGSYEAPVVDGLLEGYQTFDALGAILAGGVLIVSLNMRKGYSLVLKRELIYKAGLIAGFGLLLIYGGMIWVGAKFSNVFSEATTRIEVLNGISTATLGSFGTICLGILVGLACFSTAVAIIIGTADYFKTLFNNSQKAYYISAIIGCLLGVLIGQLDVAYIIKIALPVLMFIYPITIVLIVLNVLPEKWISPIVFRGVIIVTFLFSIPDFLKFVFPSETLTTLQQSIPGGAHSLGWVLPAIVTFAIVNLVRVRKN